MGLVRTVLKDEREAPAGYTLLVAVENPDPLEQLLRTARDLARGNDGELLVVSVVHKPVTSPFLLFTGDRIGEEFDEGRRALLDRAVSLADDVPTRRHLLVGSDVSDAVLRAAREGDADAILLGWRDRPRPSDIVLGATVDPVLRRAPCDVYVERVGTTANGLESVLVPTVGGPHAEAAADVAAAVAAANDATVTVVNLHPPNGTDDEIALARERVEETVEHLRDVDVERAVEPADDVASAIVESAEWHDLVVLGATRERRLRRRIVGSVAQQVVRDADPPVVVARRGSGGSLLSRLLGR